MSRAILADQDFGNVSRILNLPDPSAAQHPATKAYVDGAVEGLAWKDSVRVASTASVTISGPGTSIDGVTLATNDRVLLKDQATASQNGIYIFNGSGTPMARAFDAQQFSDLEQAVVSVEEGTANANTTFRQTAVNGTIGSTAVSWSTFGTSAAAATETVAGIAEVATQAETDTGTDDQRMVTPLKLTNWAGRLKKFAQAVGDGSAVSFNVDHNLNTRDVTVAVYRNSGSFDEVIADITRPSVNRVTVGFTSAPAANAYRVVVAG